MKKNKVLLLTALVILFLFAFAACDNGKGEETVGTPEGTKVETDAGVKPNDSTKGTENFTESEKATETETQTEPHTHAFGEWKTVKAATCTAKGEQERVCACGEKETQILNMWEHTEIIDNAVAPTCTETGLTEGLHCEICNAVLVQQKTVAVIDHVESDWIIDNEATKTEDGKKHTECTMCKEVMKEEIAYATGSLGLAYTVNEDGTTCTVTGMGTCTDTEVFIPGMIDNYKVTAIADKAFAEVSGVTKIVLLNGVQTIGTRAFYSCTDLTEITIPKSVTDIGTQVFNLSNKLATVYYNSSYTGNSSTGNANNFLNRAHITKVVFGSELIPSYILSECTNIKEVVITDGVTTIGDHSFYGCSSMTHISIPDSVTKIGPYAFNHCKSLTSITIPDNVTSIGKCAFNNCEGLTSITIPDGITSIGYSTFSGCRGLTTITIPDSVISIGKCAFSGCRGLENITIPNSITSIDEEAFSCCSSLTNITIPNSVTSIGSGAFYQCSSLTSISLPFTGHKADGSSSTHFDYIFKNNNGPFDIPSSLKTVVITKNITNISHGAFSHCANITSVTFPDSVTSIGAQAFQNCSSLTSITIPNSVTSIGNYAFYGCSSLNTVYYTGSEEEWKAINISSDYPNDKVLTNANIIYNYNVN